MRVGPELVIGFVGAAGTDLKQVGELFDRELARVDYRTDIVRLSDLLLDCDKYRDLRGTQTEPQDERIRKLMGAGDDLRRTSTRGDAVALLAVGRIRQLREDRGGANGRPLPRHAFLLHSLKHPAELLTLREVYGDAFVAVSVYTPRAQRLKALSERISRSRSDYRPEAYKEVATALIDEDEKGKGGNLGQNVRDTFPDADLFIDAGKPDDLPQQVSRLVEILFRHPYRTPTADECGLFHAKAAALRSADLARQVGAVITTSEGEIVAVGCNEVPKAGGGAVWEGQDRDKDRRDFVIGHDSSARMKHEILAESSGGCGIAGGCGRTLLVLIRPISPTRRYSTPRRPPWRERGSQALSSSAGSCTPKCRRSRMRRDVGCRSGTQPSIALHSHAICARVTLSPAESGVWYTSSLIRKAWRRICTRDPWTWITTQRPIGTRYRLGPSWACPRSATWLFLKCRVARMSVVMQSNGCLRRRRCALSNSQPTLT